jgi:low affinity Fe/Cu permease
MNLITSSSWFNRFARATARAAGQPIAVTFAALVIVIWLFSGPFFGFSNTWQLIINTGTTIVTFLMVFLIQNTQNRDSEAMHVKLDELIRAIEGAHNALLNLEELDEKIAMAVVLSQMMRREPSSGAAGRLTSSANTALTGITTSSAQYLNYVMRFGPATYGFPGHDSSRTSRTT